MRITTLLFALFALAVGCQHAPEDDGAPPPPATLGRWTKAFLEPANVVAQTIRVTGPPALRDHFVLPNDPETSTTTTKATNEGLLHVVVVDVEPGQVRAAMDTWQLVATRRLEVLERPGEVDVVIEMSGDAMLQRFAGDEPGSIERGPKLRFVGELVP